MNTIKLNTGETRTLTADPLQHSNLRVYLPQKAHFILLVNGVDVRSFQCSVDCGADSVCRIVYVQQMCCNDAQQRIVVNLTEPNAIFEYYGLCNADQNTAHRASIEVFHNVPQCSSRQLFKAIANDEAQVSFDGKIIVAKGAQQTSALQVCKGILLNRRARISALPHLEIYADDVKCSHGAAIGHLNQEQMFYLRSRGIEQTQARQMLVEAFAQEILEQAAF